MVTSCRAVLVLLACAAVLSLASCRARTVTPAPGATRRAQTVVPRREPPEVVLDRRTRAWAERTRAADVEALVFYGAQVGRFANDPLVVRDRRTIERVLGTLRHAITRHLELANRANTLEVRMKPRGGRRLEPKVLSFSAISALDGFGPEFLEELKRLGIPSPDWR